jgi:hypothetical protein
VGASACVGSQPCSPYRSQCLWGACAPTAAAADHGGLYSPTVMMPSVMIVTIGAHHLGAPAATGPLPPTPQQSTAPRALAGSPPQSVGTHCSACSLPGTAIDAVVAAAAALGLLATQLGQLGQSVQTAAAVMLLGALPHDDPCELRWHDWMSRRRRCAPSWPSRRHPRHGRQKNGLL